MNVGTVTGPVPRSDGERSLYQDTPVEYRGRGCPSAFVGGRDFYGEWLAWQIDLARAR